MEILKKSIYEKEFDPRIDTVFSLVTFSQATLVNTKWKPQAESPRIQHLEFKKDTLFVLFTNGRQPEVMSFSQRHDSLLIKKISGEGASCAIGAEGLYRIEWLADGEKLVFSNINDVCPGRVRGFITNPFERVAVKIRRTRIKIIVD